jgi:hypothetical protein
MVPQGFTEQLVSFVRVCFIHPPPLPQPTHTHTHTQYYVWFCAMTDSGIQLIISFLNLHENGIPKNSNIVRRMNQQIPSIAILELDFLTQYRLDITIHQCHDFLQVISTIMIHCSHMNPIFTHSSYMTISSNNVEQLHDIMIQYVLVGP